MLDIADRDATQGPPEDGVVPPAGPAGGYPPGEDGQAERYRPLPTGSHGLDRGAVERDQRLRLQSAMIELTAQKGYAGVRIADLTRLAHVSRPSFYSLFADKEELFLSAYEAVVARTARTIMAAYTADGSQGLRLLAAMRAFADLAAGDPDAMSLFMLGAFGAGAGALERRRVILGELEARILASRDGTAPNGASDLTVKAILGGIREVTATRLREGRAQELRLLAEDLAAWAASYPPQLPCELKASPFQGRSAGGRAARERARRATTRLPSGRSDLPRTVILQSQRERIVDATAAIVAEKGLAALTIPEIARRASVSNQTFYDIYPSKHDAFLGAQKVSLHQALQITYEAFSAHPEDWPSAVAAGMRSLIDYLASEPALAHLSVVDTFAASPEAIEIRNTALASFASYLRPGPGLACARPDVPEIAAEAVTGGLWQILHHYIEGERIAKLPALTPQLIYLALTPFIGPEQATATALSGAPAPEEVRS